MTSETCAECEAPEEFCRYGTCKKFKPSVFIEAAQPLTAEGIKKVCEVEPQNNSLQRDISSLSPETNREDKEPEDISSEKESFYTSGSDNHGSDDESLSSKRRELYKRMTEIEGKEHSLIWIFKQIEKQDAEAVQKLLDDSFNDPNFSFGSMCVLIDNIFGDDLI